jgi:DNA invertase Pin-like site-specific DNA recombinase
MHGSVPKELRHRGESLVEYPDAGLWKTVGGDDGVAVLIQDGVPIATEKKPTIFRMTIVQRPSRKRWFPRRPRRCGYDNAISSFFASRNLFSEWISRDCTTTMGFEKAERRDRMLIGYARVSTEEQSLDLQLDALKAAACQRVFTDKVSTTKADHPGLADAVSHLRAKDVLVIWKLDRLGRTVKGLVDFVADLQERKIQFRSLTDGIDTTTPAGRFFFHIMASLAQMERKLLAERTRAGLAAARRRGRLGGRKRRMTPGKVESARKLLKGGMAPRDVAQSLGVSIPTLYRWVPAASR